VADDPDRLARRIVREHVRLRSHLPPLDPLCQLPPDDESVEMAVAVDIDLAAFQTSDGSQQLLAVQGIRETADFMLYVPEWRRLYCLANDGESVIVGDGDAMAGEVAWAAVYRRGELVASLVERQEGDNSDLR
jgi:hypothetical protein